jgi:fused signal recognition particle receptor
VNVPEIVLAVLGVLVLLIAGGVALVVSRRRGSTGAGTDVLDREPNVGDDPGMPPPPRRSVETIPLPDTGVAEPPAEEVIAPRGRFRDRLGRSRATLGKGIGGLLRRGAGDEEAWEELEEALLAADVGVVTSTELVEKLRARAKAEKADSGPALRALLRDELLEVLGRDTDRSLGVDPLNGSGGPSVVLVVGVNGTGKTTTVGKLALALSEEGKTPVLAAADTFRAAATEQLAIWGERTGATVVRQGQGADVLLVDTAGRLHTKTNLMEELRKIRRVLEREGGAIREVLLVLDATTGQNGLTQARQFTDAVGVTGVVLTKLDGTARGGIVIAVQRELGIPVKLVGLGEGPYDLAPFDPEAFVDAILEDESPDTATDDAADR